MARSLRGFNRAPSQRRKTAWDFGSGSTGATSISSSSTTIIGSGAAIITEGVTFIRTRGSLQAFLKTSDGANGGFHCGFGIGVATAEAFAVGATALPSPLADASFDGWLYHRFFDCHTFDATIASSMVNNLAVVQFEVDSKAMRKVPAGVTIYAVLETVELQTATMSVFFDSRSLFKLP